MDVQALKEQAMAYRQLARKLRLTRDGAPVLVSERPYDEEAGIYLDLDDAGNSTTVIEYTADVVNRDVFIAKHLRLGAIEEVAAIPGKQVPANKTEQDDEEGEDNG